MKKIFILFTALLLTNVALAQQPEKPTLVVFVVGFGNTQLNDYLINLLSNNLSKTYTIIPRTEAVKKKIMELKEYEDAGHVDDRQLIEWGRQNNVSMLCLVTVVNIGEYLFSAQLTDVKTNTLMNSAEYEIPSVNSEDLKKTASALAEQLQRKK